MLSGALWPSWLPHLASYIDTERFYPTHPKLTLQAAFVYIFKTHIAVNSFLYYENAWSKLIS